MTEQPSGPIKKADDLGRTESKRAKRFKDWPPIPEWGFAKSFCEGELCICVRSRGDSTQWGAVLQFAGEEGFRRRVDSTTCHNDGSGRHPHLNQSLVFTDKVKLVERIDYVVPSTVRFELFDSELIGVREPFHFFEGSVVVKASSVAPYREIDIRWPYVAVSLSERHRENVEAASQHMDDRTRFGAYDRGHGSDNFNPMQLIAGLTIWLDNSNIRVCAAPSVESVAQHIDLGYGPIDRSLCV